MEGAGCLANIVDEPCFGVLATGERPAAAESLSASSALMLAGVGNRPRSAKNQSDRLLPAKWVISRKQGGG
jgi:hypothetical protein